MELNLFKSEDFSWASFNKSNIGKVESIYKICSSHFQLYFANSLRTKYLCDKSIKLLFGHSELANDIKMELPVPVTLQLTLTSTLTGRLMITTKCRRGDDDKCKRSEVKDVDIFEKLYDFQEILPPNSFQFILSFRGFHSGRDPQIHKRLNFEEKVLKLTRNQDGSACLDMTDMQIPEPFVWNEWKRAKDMCSGHISLKLKLDIDAFIVLHKKHFECPSNMELDTATDLVIWVGGNKEKAIKCHKSILSEMSPVFAAMFQTDMLEAREGSLEIADFSEPCILALVEFAYRRNVEKALKSNEMALELLKAADKYQMKELMEVLQHFFWLLPLSRFSADEALKLYILGNNAGEELVEAKSKGLKVLKWYAACNPGKLIESQEGVRLCENPRAVMELVVEILNEKFCIDWDN